MNFVFTQQHLFHFYTRQQNASRILAMAWASVRLSNCLSVRHTLQPYQNSAR